MDGDSSKSEHNMVVPDHAGTASMHAERRPPAKFFDPDVTATGERRASVALEALRTLWLNTGTLCNLTCVGCYIESSPRNDRLAYLTHAEARAYFDEARQGHPELTEIGFTGGEPFLNPDFTAMLGDALDYGWRALVLTNAMKPMQHARDELLALKARHGSRLSLRVSLDHYTGAGHERIRGVRTWRLTLDGLAWLATHGFDIAVASRMPPGESESALRASYRNLFAELGIAIDANDPARLVLFPEMDETADVAEITVRCWGILGIAPSSIMCANSRMVVKRKGEAPSVVACTLLPYDMAFDFGPRLAGATGPVKLNHPHCARFCVLGGATCSPNAGGGDHSPGH